MTIEEYQQLVESLFDANSTLLIENGTADHAIVLVNTLFNKATKEVFVFCQNLKAVVYDSPSTMESIFAALRRGVKVRILTQEAPEAWELMHRFKSVPSHLLASGLLVFKQCAKGSPAAAWGFNFTVMDRKAFRYEPDRTDCKAEACANAPDVAQTFLARIEPIFDSDETTLVPLL